MRLLLLIVISLFISTHSNILVILDNLQLKKTHSIFFSLLKKYDHVQFATSFQKQKIQLKAFDKFKYQHIIIMCTSQKQIDSKIKVNEIVSYFDEGGNVIVIGDIDTSRSFRKLFYSFGIDLEQTGTLLKDSIHHYNSYDLISTTNYQNIQPFVTPSSSKLPLLYRGIGLNLVNYVNYQLYNLVKGQPTIYSRNVELNKTVKAGSSMSLVAGVQGLNNARALLTGSLDFFSDQIFRIQGYYNQKLIEDLLSWTFKRKGIIKIHNMTYYGQNSNQIKQTLFNVGEKIHFEVNAEILNFETNKWQPYEENLQLEFVMLDPWVRVHLHNTPGTSKHQADFYAPSKEGIYQFKIIYKKPGYLFLTESQRVTVRPYKHDQFERFLIVAYPYYLGLFLTIISTFIFILGYLYSQFGKVKKE